MAEVRFGGRGFSYGLRGEAQKSPADTDYLSVLQSDGLLNGHAVQARAVQRPGILDEPAAVGKKDLRMPAGGVFIVQDDDVLVMPAQGDRSLRIEVVNPGFSLASFDG